MATLSELRTRVRDYLDEPTAVFWTDAQLNTWINQALNFYYSWIAQAYEGYFAKDVLIDIVSGQGKYPLPSDHYKTVLLERVFATYTIPLRVFSRKETANLTSNTNFSNLYLPTYRFEGQNHVLEPTPDVDITDGLRLEYVPQPTQMTADGESPPAGFLDFWQEVLVLRAAIAAKQKEEAVVNQGTDISSLKVYLAEWEQNVKESFEQRTQQRRHTEPFGQDDGDSYYYP